MRNEKGITLIELLAAITILLIISSLIYEVLIGVNRNYNQISEKTNLEQEANVIVATIKRKHQQEDSYYITYNETTKRAYIGKNIDDNTLLGENIAKFQVGGDGAEAVPDIVGKYKISSNNFITIYLELKKQGNPVSINTVIKRY